LIDAHHPRELKEAIYAKFKERNTSSHLTRITTISIKLSSFVKAT